MSYRPFDLLDFLGRLRLHLADVCLTLTEPRAEDWHDKCASDKMQRHVIV